MEALLPAAKFLLYAVGIYFLAGITISVLVLLAVLVIACVAGSKGSRR